MISDPESPFSDHGPSVSITDTVWGAVVRTRDVLGIAAAVRLRRLARRRCEGIVILDLRATSVAASIVVAAVADLAADLRAHEGVLRIVHSSRTPQVLIDAAGAPVFTSLAEALGCRPDGGARDIPHRAPLPPGAPVGTHPTPLDVPHPRRPDVG